MTVSRRSAMALRARTTRAELSKYDPDKGLKAIAVAESAEKHYARAKDAAKLHAAIRAKLEAQQAFVFWWDTQATKAEGRPPRKRSRSATLSISGKNGIPERYVIDRWRRKLKDGITFENTFQQAVARYVKILEFAQTAHVSQNSGENEWYTPREYIEAARTVLGAIDLDPASSKAANKVIKAAHIFTADDDGLTKQWDGRVWMNPPYAQPLVSKFCAKLADSVRAGSVTAAIVLVNNATETAWFRAVVEVAISICFPAGRVRFWQPDISSASPLQGQAILYIGDQPALFCTTFAPFGFIADISRC